MKQIPPISSVAQVRIGQNAHFDAWLYNMMIDNNIAYEMNPDIIAAPEQISFMVDLEKDQIYLPCSDQTFSLLMKALCPPELQKQYNRAWRIIVRLIRSIEPDRKARRRSLQFCRFRFRQYVKQHTLIPARVVKRMTNLALAHSCQDDPWEARRRESTRKAHMMLGSSQIQRAINATPPAGLHGDIASIRRTLNHMELARLLFLSMMSRPWEDTPPSPLALDGYFDEGLRAAESLRDIFCAENDASRTVLFLCDADGGIIQDMAVLFRIMRMGHKVILALKSGFYFYAPTITDADTDPTLKQYLERGVVVHDPAISKNELLRLLREHRLVVISDGTRERLNLFRTSVTFARAWKEADIILAKGWRNKEILLETSQKFTRDIVCYWLNKDGVYHIAAKPRAEGVHKFSEATLMEMADAIIAQMREAQRAGKSVMFYSCIIGSIPGQTSTAIQLARAFVAHLRKKLADTFIVNPTEHFVDGMDGDDLMFMWERVQRSGYIDVWRFQTVQDIEESFALLERRIPPAWAGKDATYSTGCTKEMRIALDVQNRNREMQIIGPDQEKFFRRSEYGVGKYFDARISDRGVSREMYHG